MWLRRPESGTFTTNLRIETWLAALETASLHLSLSEMWLSSLEGLPLQLKACRTCGRSA